ncbi:unnamed protein product [Chrysoparadoxa australica]
MPAHWRRRDLTSQPTDKPPTLHSLNESIRRHGLKGEWKRCIMELVQIAALGLRPDTTTFNELIKGCIIGGQERRALEVFRKMMVEGVTPDEYTYNRVLDILGAAERWEEAAEILQVMQKKGFHVDLINQQWFDEGLGLTHLKSSKHTGNAGKHDPPPRARKNWHQSHKT